MTEETRLEMAKLFLAAKGFLLYQDAVFVCNALRRAYYRYCFPMHIVDEAEKLIDSRIPGCMTVRRWLVQNHPELKPQLTNENMLTYRLAWVDSIIKELDPEGKVTRLDTP